jgi:hypothetical protein
MCGERWAHSLSLDDKYEIVQQLGRAPLALSSNIKDALPGQPDRAKHVPSARHPVIDSYSMFSGGSR